MTFYDFLAVIAIIVAVFALLVAVGSAMTAQRNVGYIFGRLLFQELETAKATQIIDNLIDKKLPVHHSFFIGVNMYLSELQSKKNGK